ncbi:uncharacterized protein LOC128706756 [Anopheles marshallii]|uniref:uncharacterized protein LOC128706756 n=1 Tax=Anopheles marshallii TaxID=1521116 RepID=UPI00237B09B1|nr:uncharacterized protein LOC128706756 [Anopheles marshallii]
MLSGRIRRRALALLGALLLVILVWPPCCATMPKPMDVVPPSAPWDVVPPARPHPAAAVLPVPVQPWTNGVGTVAAKRHHVPLGLDGERQQQDQEQQDPAESERRKSRRVSEFYRLLRALSPIAQPAPTVEPNERRQSEVSAVQLNLPTRENSAVRDARDYLIEPIDKNKSQSVRSSALDPTTQDNAPGRVHARFDDTDPSPALMRGRREAVPTNAHRHQHQIGPGGPLNGTGVWHGRRGGGGRHHHQQAQQQQHRNNESNLERNERSANLSHITGATRKIQLFIKNRYIQLLPDGTVNGTYDELSDYTILQRTTVGIGQIKIQAVATCLFLCMDTCGSVYGSKEFTDDCIFNEQMEQHHYNTYSSTQHSNARRTLYLALNKTGQPRKIQIPVNRTLGKLATYTKALTQTVAHDRVEQLISRLFGADHVRHGLNQLCETGQPLEELTAKEMRPRPVCGPQAASAKAVGAVSSVGGGGGGKKNSQPNTSGKDDKDGLRQKKKKKRRKCREDEVPGEQCFRPGVPGTGVGGTNSGKKKAGPNQGQPRGGSSISSDSGSISPSSSNSSVGSSSAGTNQSAILSNVTSSSSSSSSSISNSSNANSLIASISNGGPNRPGQPYAQLTATPNTRKPKPTKKLPSGPRNGTPPPNGGSAGPSRKPKKPNQQPQQAVNGKRNGTNHTKPSGPAKAKLVSASIVTSKLSQPKPASLMIARTVRPTAPFPLATARPTTKPTTVSNDLQDTSQQSDSDAELDMDDVLQPSAELADELDELDEVPGSPTASSWHELLPTSSVSEQRNRYKALSCCSFLSLSTLVVYGATVHLLYL